MREPDAPRHTAEAAAGTEESRLGGDTVRRTLARVGLHREQSQQLELSAERISRRRRRDRHGAAARVGGAHPGARDRLHTAGPAAAGARTSALTLALTSSPPSLTAARHARSRPDLPPISPGRRPRTPPPRVPSLGPRPPAPLPEPPPAPLHTAPSPPITHPFLATGASPP